MAGKVAKKSPAKKGVRSTTPKSVHEAKVIKKIDKAVSRAKKPFGSTKVGAKNIANAVAKGAPKASTKAGKAENKAGKKSFKKAVTKDLAKVKSEASAARRKKSKQRQAMKKFGA